MAKAKQNRRARKLANRAANPAQTPPIAALSFKKLRAQDVRWVRYQANRLPITKNTRRELYKYLRLPEEARLRGPTAREELRLGKEGVDIMKRIGEEREAAMERQGTKGRPKDWWLGDDEQMEAEEKGKEDGGDEEDGDDGGVLLAGFESPVMMSPVASGQIDEEMEGPEALES